MENSKIASLFTHIDNQHNEFHREADSKLIVIREIGGTCPLKCCFSSPGDMPQSGYVFSTGHQKQLSVLQLLKCEVSNAAIASASRPQRRWEKEENTCEEKISVINGILALKWNTVINSHACMTPHLQNCAFSSSF